MAAHISIIPAAEINYTKWDACIHANSNGLIYATSQFQNILSKNWHALIINNYEAVMPLPWKKKWGIRYCYQPPFMQQLGLIGNLSKIDVKQVAAAIGSFVQYGEWAVNFNNRHLTHSFQYKELNNLVLDLSVGYDKIYQQYKKDLINNLRKAAKLQFNYVSSNNVTRAVDLYEAYYAGRTEHVLKQDYKHFKTLCHQLHKQNKCLVREVHNSKGDLLSIALLLMDGKRLYNMMNTTTAEGRSTEANHFLIDAIVQEFSNQKLLFDFEGSDIPGVKKFYEKFGASNQPYYLLHHNNLPGPLRLLKK